MPKLSSVKVSTSIKDALERAGFHTAQEVLLCRDSELQQKTNLTLGQCRELKLEAGKCVCPVVFMPAFEMVVIPRLTTGCAKLDALLRGGLPTRGITEISGESGCGKTQLCLQLSLTSQWPLESGGLAGGVLYICTEDVYPSRRLQQLLSTFPSPPLKPANSASIKYGDNIFVEHIADADSLWHCLKQRAPQLMSRHPVRLLVIDSVAGVFRTDLENGAVSRAKALRSMARQLLRLSVKYGVAVICVNQVAEAIVEEGDERRGQVTKEVPALGLCWANLTHTRLRMSRDHAGTRFIEALTSPELPSGVKWPFEISARGLFGS